MKNTFAILYYGKKQATKKNGKMPIYARVTIKSSKTQILTHAEVSVNIWDAKAGRAIGKSKEAAEINSMLDGMTARLKNLYNEYLRIGESVTPVLLKQAFLGQGTKFTYLLEYFKQINEKKEQGIGETIAQSTYNKYALTYERIGEFLRKKRNNMSDILLNRIDFDFISDFNDFLRTDKKLSINSAAKLVHFCIADYGENAVADIFILVLFHNSDRYIEHFNTSACPCLDSVFIYP